jgi:polar amino acid transport system substrate-binding protein
MNLEEFKISSMGLEVYGTLAIIALFLTYIYYSKKDKKKIHSHGLKDIELFKKACEVAEDAMLILSYDHKITYANRALVSLFDLQEEFLNQAVDVYPEVKMNKKWQPLDIFLKEQLLRISAQSFSLSDIILRVKGKKEIPINLHCNTFVVNAKEDLYDYIITIKNLTDTQKTLKMLYRHKLTNLPNQNQALHDLPSFYAKTHLEENKIALLLMDFDNFSRLRSFIGYEQANEIIIKFSQYLLSIGNDMNLRVYHTYDNHFLLTASNVVSVESIKELVKEIQSKLSAFYRMDETNLHLTVSVGIALYPDSGPTRSLMDNAYKALEQAQKEGEGKIVAYLPKKEKETFDELTLHNSMQQSLDNGEFEVYYQPIVDANTEEVVAAEALIRWIHPKYGFISPDNFIHLMEKTGFIIKLGQFILEDVLKQQKRWELFKFKQITVSINVSMSEIVTGEFIENVQKQLQHHQVNPERIKFEITEGMAMLNEDETVRYFHSLKKLGVGISLDDFGTGYTSFTYLKKFPADTLKIDKSLVDYILENEEDKRIVKAMIELGHNLGMKIVVEGVESKPMVEILRSYKCDYIQGYYFSRPLPVFEFQKLLR